MLRRPASVLVLVLALVLMGGMPALADDAVESGESAATEESGLGSGATWKIQLIALEFGGDRDLDEAISEIEDLFDAGLGFGGIYRLSLFIQATGLEDLDAFLEAARDPETGELDFGWGELWRSLTDEELALLEGLPRNLGQLVSEARRGHSRPDHAGPPDDRGRPEHAGRPDHAGPKD